MLRDEWPPISTLTGCETKTPDDSIPIWCHCRGIDFVLHRGNYNGKIADELPWFIDPKTYKSIATFDSCDSCRLQSGVDIFNWTFSELANISLPNTLQQNRKGFPQTTSALRAAVDAGDPVIGTLAYYRSSPDVQRYFCRTCAATVFYAVDDRPALVDVAIGLLDAPDGARAESFLSWDFGGEASWVGDAKDGWREVLNERVQAEAEGWRIRRGYPMNWRRIEREVKKE
jgi:hypothetical protein